MKRLVTALVGVLVAFSCMSGFAAPLACALPGAFVRMDRLDGGGALLVELHNGSSSLLELSSWSMSDASVDLSATTASGNRLRRFVPLGSPGINRIKLQPGERRAWTYRVDDAFPDLQASLETESVLLEWKFKLVPYGSNCSMTTSGSVRLEKMGLVG